MLEVAEDCVRTTVRRLLSECAEELSFFEERQYKQHKQQLKQQQQQQKQKKQKQGQQTQQPPSAPRTALLERLQQCEERDFARMSYTEAVEVLQRSGPSSDPGRTRGVGMLRTRRPTALWAQR